VGDKPFDDKVWHESYADKQSGRLIHSGKYDGLSFPQAIEAIASELESLNLGTRQTTWRLRDWGISRQRYWGTPIPIIHCDNCGAVPVPEKDLPVVLPEDLIPDGSGNPLTKHASFLHCQCPSCGKDARRETDTMDTFVDSSWYFMRYTSPGNDQEMVDTRNDYWMPMDQYIGGIEHAVMHLLYARFWTRVMRDLGLVKFDEPFTKLLCQGMVLNHIYSTKNAKGGIEYFWPEEVENTYDAKGAITGARLKSDGREITYGGVGTMSKSKNNGVDPQSLIDTQGADTARLFVMFTSPPEQTLEWSDSGVEGSNRFLRRLWSLGVQNKAQIAAGLQTPVSDWAQAPKEVKQLRFEIHALLKQADYDYQRIQYNTVVSACMKMLNAIDDAVLGDSSFAQAAYAETIGILLRVLYPVVPHITWQLWAELGYAEPYGDLLDAPWPTVDASALMTDEVELVLQVNGKLRGSLSVAREATREQIEQIAIAHESVARNLEGRPPKRVIVVPGKLVNVVG
jgi:leucyl-tRNA synthetase